MADVPVRSTDVEVGDPHPSLHTQHAGDINNLQSQINTEEAKINSHIGNSNNPHTVTKAQVGLGDVDNTGDLAKPISTATQAALDGKSGTGHLHDDRYYTEAEVDAALANKTDLGHLHSGYAPNAHDHDGDYEASGAVAAHNSGAVHTDTQRTDEEIQDVAAVLLDHEFHTNLSALYDDANNRVELTASTSGGGTSTDTTLTIAHNGTSWSGDAPARTFGENAIRFISDGVDPKDPTDGIASPGNIITGWDTWINRAVT